MALIYCVEDDESIRELVGYALQRQGHQTKGFDSAAGFYEAMKKDKPALAILDIMLPGEDGISILKKLRSSPETERLPVIMMTAKAGEADIVRGLDLGADDYVTKPFGIMELLSRVRSLLRRSYPKEADTSVMTFEGILVDQKRHLVTVDGKETALTLKEFDLLCYLMLNKEIVLSREQIMQKVWDLPFEVESRTIDMHIKSLRKKLKPYGKLIETVRGIGYRLGGRP